MAVYRFLASVKLAVLSILSLAGSLAYATWYEKRHGATAVQLNVYESPWFSILLAFLATNILCAALIRFPWKRRQTGFVVTHVGLLTLIFGSWWGFQYSDEGQAGSPEGGVVNKLVRSKFPMVRVREIDRRGEPGAEYELPFNGGAFDWPAGKYRVISKPKDPFKVAVKGFFPSSQPGPKLHVPSPEGSPMLALRPRIKAPGATEMTDVFADPDRRWFILPADAVGRRETRRAGPAKFAFLQVDRPEMVDDFLDPPKDPGTLGVARLRYVDKAGKARVHEIRIDDVRPETAITLPGSDLTVTSIEAERKEPDRREIADMLGDTELYLVKFDVRKGNDPGVLHMAFSGQPMFPATMAAGEGHGKAEALVAIHYFRPPLLGGGGMAGNFGVVEVLGDPAGKLYYRVFGRADASADPSEANLPRPGVLRKPPAPLKIGETVVAFGGNKNMPMTLDFAAEAYLLSGEEKPAYQHMTMPEGKQSDGVGAALVELTVGGETKEIWARRPLGLELPTYEVVAFKGGLYEVAFDCSREDLGFAMTLTDFEVKHDPGTAKPASYKSEVLLTDEKAGIKDKPITITMNHPLTHRKFTFYQSSFDQERDPRSGRPTGDFTSVFQVGHDAGRPLKYAGSLLIVFGAFLQFYMKAGVFSHVAKPGDDPKAAERARKLRKKKGEKALPAAARNVKAKTTKNYDEAIL